MLLLLKRRGWLLPTIAEQALTLTPNVFFSICLDDPDPGVEEGLEAMKAVLGPERYVVYDAIFPALGERERWMQLRQFQFKTACDKFDPTHGCIWDDDHILADLDDATQKLREDWDLVYATKLFLWDTADRYNARMPQHRSVFFFKVLPGDAFPVDRTIHAPIGIHDFAKKITDLKAPLLDYGYMHRLARERVFRDYVRVGKIDAATRPLVEPPDLRPLPKF